MCQKLVSSSSLTSIPTIVARFRTGSQLDSEGPKLVSTEPKGEVLVAKVDDVHVLAEITTRVQGSCNSKEPLAGLVVVPLVSLLDGQGVIRPTGSSSLGNNGIGSITVSSDRNIGEPISFLVDITFRTSVFFR